MLADFLLPMLSWNHETRASAEEMLKHPWLDMGDNYDFKYTDREYEVMMLKKELKTQMKGGNNANQDEADQDGDRQEMNELIDSDPELYSADVEDIAPTKKKTQKQKLKAEIQSQLNNQDINLGQGILSNNLAADEVIFAELFNEEEISLQDCLCFPGIMRPGPLPKTCSSIHGWIWEITTISSTQIVSMKL